LKKNTNYLVSIIVNCYNSQKYLKETIKSITSQTYLNYEVIFYDNQSSDNTVKIIKSFNNSKFKIHSSKSKLVLGEARNKAIKKAKGDYIAFLDSDDYWAPNKLELQIKKFQSFPNLGLVYSDAIYFNSKKEMQLYKYRKAYAGNCTKPILLDYFLCMSSCLVKMDIIKKYKIFFDNQLMVCEDPDFFLQISYYSDFDYCRQPLTYYRLHESSLTANNRELFFDEINIIISKIKQIPNFDINIINTLINNNNVNRAKYYWSLGKSIKAIKQIIYHLKIKNLYYILVFLIPYKICNYIFNKINKNRVAY